MTTCISLGCQFTQFCKNYDLSIDRGYDCDTQELIIDSARRVMIKNLKKHRIDRLVAEHEEV